MRFNLYTNNNYCFIVKRISSGGVTIAPTNADTSRTDAVVAIASHEVVNIVALAREALAEKFEPRVRRTCGQPPNK